MKKQITCVFSAIVFFFLIIGFYSQVKAQDIDSFRADFLSTLDLYQELAVFLQGEEKIYEHYLTYVDEARQIIIISSDEELALLAGSIEREIKWLLSISILKRFSMLCRSTLPRGFLSRNSPYTPLLRLNFRSR